MIVERCRVCGADGLKPILSLGTTPLANRFLSEAQLPSPEPAYPLDVLFCPACFLVCLSVVVPPEILFRNYIYVSSTSDTIPQHFAQLATEVAERVLGPRDGLVVEIGSNDGCLLKGFRARGGRVLGIEPAVNIAALAQSAGIPTLNDFFSEALARVIRKNHGPAGVIIANNVVAHIDNLADLMRGITHLLTPDGVLLIEVPYLLDLLERCEYDTIYHEHLSYFSVETLARLFATFGVSLFDVKRLGVHGGSIRVYGSLSARRPVAEAVHELRDLERRRGLASYEAYLSFAEAVQRNRTHLLALLRGLRAQGHRLAGYGAPAKGNTLLNHCGIGPELLDYLVDRSPYKQGLYTPGMRLPVFPVEKLLADPPDYLLLLAWNFADEILQQQDRYRANGGRFILPIPTPRIL